MKPRTDASICFSFNARFAKAVIILMRIKPTMICLNETWLDPSVKEVSLEGFVLLGRRDRRDGRKCGGVAVFVSASQADCVTLVKDSDDS